EASPGEDLEIPVYISTNRDLLGLQFYIRYNTDFLEITDFEFTESLPAFIRIFEGGVGVASILPSDSEFDGFAGNLHATVSPDAPIGSEILLAFSNDPHKILYTGLVDSTHSDQSGIIELHFIHPEKNDGIINVVEGRLIEDDENIFLDFSTSPNPFNSSTNITFRIANQADIRIDILDILGRRINNLFDGYLTAGSHSVVWNPDQLPSGVYFCRLAADNHSITKRITFLK
ncbi:MAG: T9SS type A sorting domain-containing protein, partial [candidate division Zixibacteria bacterium]